MMERSWMSFSLFKSCCEGDSCGSVKVYVKEQ